MSTHAGTGATHVSAGGDVLTATDAMDECRELTHMRHPLSACRNRPPRRHSSAMSAPTPTPTSTPAEAQARAAVFKASAFDAASAARVRGYDFNGGVDWAALLAAYATTGFQGTSLAQAIAEVRRMLAWRLADEPVADDEAEHLRSAEARARVRCTIFLGFTSNLVSSGVRDVIRYLCEHGMIDAVVTTAGGVEEDLIKCLADTYIGDFALAGADLRERGVNRIGNLLVPNDNYCRFEDWVMPVLDAMLAEQHAHGRIWSPAQVCERLGREIGNRDSFLYWCAMRSIPVFCPALTDGSLGDMLYMHSFRHERPLVVDIVQDLRRLNSLAAYAKRSGVIVLGGGLVKHHILNANLMRNGADHAVLINTSSEFDGSDAGARPDEAVSWGKLRVDGSAVKVYADATLVFPLLVAETFATHWQAREADV